MEKIPVRRGHDATVPSTARQPRTASEIVDLIDKGWRDFHAAAMSFPSEHMDEHIGEGWTRKQMLAHITAWHDLTNERLVHLLTTGEPGVLKQDTDTINARVARQAVGRTGGEVLKDMELSFNKLRRQVGRLVRRPAGGARRLGCVGSRRQHVRALPRARRRRLPTAATAGRGARR